MPSRLDEDPIDTKLVVGVETNPTPPPKHLTLRLLIYLGIAFVVFAIVLSILGWFYIHDFKKNVKSADLSSASQRIKDLNSANAASTSSELSPENVPWINYKNIMQNYTLSYPSNWDLAEDTQDTVILFPPNSRIYASLTQEDIGAGKGPEMSITIITRPFAAPSDKYTVLTTNTGLKGYSFIDDTANIPTIDFPFKGGSQMLEFTLNNIDKQSIDEHLKAHNSIMVVSNIDSNTFEKIAKSLMILK